MSAAEIALRLFSYLGLTLAGALLAFAFLPLRRREVLLLRPGTEVTLHHDRSRYSGVQMVITDISYGRDAGITVQMQSAGEFVGNRMIRLGGEPDE